MKEKRDENRERLQMWQSVDTWADYEPVWAKQRKKPFRTHWEIKSFHGSEEKITGKPLFPHKKCLGRTPRRWVLIIIFFIIFYSVLFSFSVAIYHMFFYVIRTPKDKPTYLDIINRSVGIALYPRMKEGDAEMNDGSFLEYIEFTSEGDDESLDFFKSYPFKAKTGVDCSYDNPPPPDRSCNFDMSQLGPCQNPFTEVCLYIKITRTIDRVPNYFESADDLPKGFPDELKSIFEGTPDGELSRYWVRCTPGFHKKINGEITSLQHFPEHSSFPGYYFPFTQQLDYQDPLVAVKVEAEGKVVIKCRAWDKSVDPSDPTDGSQLFIFHS